ncbi:MAG: xylulokinase [Acetobacteraceae bacterium]|nr:xylulokinase [Acetobacteraceae bacterium]MBV8525623.1 xylulokinase [Acetobacteraceae bacterium]MBV8590907.1 xylulokinase [Acetobacteraceae bacterium]
MFIGLDLGTSSIKAILVDREERTIAAASERLAIQRPGPGRSEQDPEAWWQASVACLDRLTAAAPWAMASVTGIGLSGQMHGAVLLDAEGVVLRPAILWNDGRAYAECRELEAAFPALRRVSGNMAMPGFTAPKLLWVRRHEPEFFQAIARVLLPKAYLRWRLSGTFLEDMSDASGTLWLDVAARGWSDEVLAATGLSRAHMPDLVEGTAPAGRLRPELARRWGMASAPILAGGAGDNAASAVGLGAVEPGSAFLSLGTSGVLWVTTDRMRPNPEAAVHAFCHAIPGRWHQMGVILSAGDALAWLASVLGSHEAELLAPLGQGPPTAGRVVFLPYLGGERTPHNNPELRGLFTGLSHATDRTALVQAVLEGVAYAFRDCLMALEAAGTRGAAADVVGGGARSRAWVAILANVLGLPLRRVQDSEAGAAIGAARLGRLAATGEEVTSVCRRPLVIEEIEPDPATTETYAEGYARYRAAYAAA